MSKVKIQSRTHFEPIRGNGPVKPRSPLWQFYNNGNTNCFINGKILGPGENFGLDNSLPVLMGMVQDVDVELEETTEFQVVFGNTIVDDSLDPNGNVIPTLILITTEYFKS